MSTIDSYSVIKELIEKEGQYPGDPPVIRIFEYRNAYGGKICWSINYTDQDTANLLTSPYCHNVELIWSKEKGKIKDPTVPTRAKSHP